MSESGVFLRKKVIKSKAFKELTKIEIQIYLEFLLKRETIESQSIVFTYKEIEKLGLAQNTFSRAKAKFVKVGFIDPAGIDQDGYSLYALSGRWDKYGTDLFVEISKIPVQEGYIYLIKSQGYYKIGIAKEVKSRFARYVTENPLPVELILYYKVQDYLNREKYLLNKFADKNLHGEWFSLEANDIKTIDKYLRTV